MHTRRDKMINKTVPLSLIIWESIYHVWHRYERYAGSIAELEGGGLKSDMTVPIHHKLYSKIY